MLIKVGEYRFNLTHVESVRTCEDGALIVGFISGQVVDLPASPLSEQFLAAWDKWVQFQAEAQKINEFAIAENLKQIEAAQNKSGIVIPKMPRGARG